MENCELQLEQSKIKYLAFFLLSLRYLLDYLDTNLLLFIKFKLILNEKMSFRIEMLAFVKWTMSYKNSSIFDDSK